MPDLCPCGSGFPLKTCCMRDGIARTKKWAAHGPDCAERRDWFASYIEYKTIINEQIIKEQENYVKSMGREISCRPGCAMCCIEFIAARIEECDAIVMYLYSYPRVMNRFLSNYTAWYEAVSSGDNILKKTSGAYQTLYETRHPEDKIRFEACALDYAKKYASCPFLDNNRCLIYPVRPFVCSTYSVVSDKTYCDPKWHMEAREHKQKIKSAMNPLSFENSYYVDLKGRLVFDSMQTMVYDIMKHGPIKSQRN